MKKLPANATTYTAVFLVALGLILLFLAWNAAAGPENGLDLRSQFPFLLSGGLGGLALVGAGLTLVRVFESRRDTNRVISQLERLTTAVERLEAAQSAQQLAEANAREAAASTAETGPLPPTGPPFEPAR